jgi:histidinol-phosphate aminotransferase
VRTALRPLGLTQGVAPAALAGPEELARAAGLRSIVRLGSNESPFGPSPNALAAIRAEAEHANRYGDPSVAELRDAVAARHHVAPANVAVGAGIDDLLGCIVRAFVPAGATAIAGLGTFPSFEMHATGSDAYVERVPYRPDGRLDLEGFIAAAHRLGGGLIFFPNPDNPSGSTYAWRDVVAFLDALPNGALVIHDEAYANFLPSSARFPRDALDPRMIRLRTFSKEYGLAGMRVGYALATPETIAALNALRLLYGVNRLAQAAALASLDDDAFVEDVVRRIADGRAEYHALGKRLALPTLSSATNFVLFDFGSAEHAKSALEALLQHGIHVRKPPFPPLDRYVRISVGTPPERLQLADALAAIRHSGAAEAAKAPLAGKGVRSKQGAI